MNAAIADWLAERRRLEEQYSSGLHALARKNLHGVDIRSSVFSVPWDALKNAAEGMADSHSQLASKIEIDVEQPLRQFQSQNREMKAMSNQQGNLAALAKEFDRAQQKADKVADRGGADTNRVANASDGLENASAQWETQAPYIFESLQAADEARLNHLRDVLTQFQTHETDLVEKLRSNAEQCLNVLLNVETADEIKTFALKTLATGGPISSRTGQPTRSSLASGTPSRPSLTPPTESFRSDEGQTPGGDKKSVASRLKRNFTVARRSSKIPPGAENIAAETADASEKDDKKGKRSLFSRKKKDTNLAIPEEEPERRPSSPSRSIGSFLRASRSHDEPAPAPARRTSEQVNGAPARTESRPISAVPPQLSIPNGSHQGDLADLDPPKPNQPEPAPLSQTPPQTERAVDPGFQQRSRTDSQGYSVPPAGLDPITQAQHDAAMSADGSIPQYNVNIRDKPIQEEGGADADAVLAAMATKLQTQAPPPSRSTGTVRGRRGEKPPVSMILQPPMPGSASSAGEISPSISPPQPAVSSPAQAFPEPSAPPESITREAPPVQSPDAISSAGASPSTNYFAPAAAGAAVGGVAAASAGAPFSPFSPADHSSAIRPASRMATADNQSIRSGKSLSSTTSQGHKHPDLQEQGLSSSIVETATARFEDNKLISSSLLGEIAMAYHPTDSQSSPIVNIRLDNFSTLERIAPNPAFISQGPEKEGEYSVNTASLSKTQIAFKYRVSADSTGSQAAPILMTPALRIEPGQTSVIVSYTLNPSFVLPQGHDSIVVSNVMLALTLEGAKPTSCQSKPVGTFSRERNLIYWQIGSVTLTPGGPAQRLLARFVTEGEAKAASIEARWEISGSDEAGVVGGSGVAVSSQSAAADPFADDDGGWKPISTVRKLVSGSYVAKS
ncbi:hypothetical protein K431DRAFT_284066 [Polychaeton citri CBS 116435]|uniref:MHD domain-containing protein n=1 Tax=Polychaeton citri CBS 116435 TaxID=1314669 RepID=A0A9P4QCF5_9PEZI|nr:hypothetical protein K431DRAFT_284066 [Polychaeton citri CBS 116435]